MTAVRNWGDVRTKEVWPRIVAWTLLVYFVTIFVSVKLTAVLGPLVLGLIVVYSLLNKSQSSVDTKFGLATFACAALLMFAAMSLLWTPNPAAAFPKLVFVSAVAASTILAYRVLIIQPLPVAIRNAEAVWIGTLVGLAYLATRVGSAGHFEDVLMQRWSHGDLEDKIAEIVRSMMPTTLFIGASILCAVCTVGGSLGRFLAALILGIAAAVIAISDHDTSKVALCSWVAIYALSFVSLRVTKHFVQLGWFVCVALVVPAALLAFDLKMHESSFLPATAQQRILIWNEVAKSVLQAPVIGHGLNSFRELQPSIVGLNELFHNQTKQIVPDGLSTFRANHPHNAYLQVWFEFGSIGALLLLVAGLTLLSKIGRMTQLQQRYAWPTATAIIVLLLPSYGIWQFWFSPLMASAFLAMGVANNISGEVFAD